jgi:hypothetical protein
MGADIESLYRSFLPNNPKVAKILIQVSKDSFKARFLPKNLVRLMTNRALDEVRRGGTEIIAEPIFVEKLEQHARSLYGRFQSQISQLNQHGGRKGV